jgi:Domain of unknown function (DUF4167)
MSTNQRSGQRNGRGNFSSKSNRSTSNSPQRRPGKNMNAEANYEKYVALARESARMGDPVETENYYQHAEHYFRVMKEREE